MSANVDPAWLGPNPKTFRRCPHCDHELSLNEAVQVLYGDGRRKFIGVRMKDAGIAVIDASFFNPATMELIE